MSAATLRLEGLPLLRWNDGWTVDDRLPSWAAFRVRGAIPTRGDIEPGVVRIWLDAPDPSMSPGPAAIAAYRELRAREAAIGASVVTAVAAACGRAPAELPAAMALHSVHVHDVDRGGLGYLGFELDCGWDPEHGLGLMMHGTRVVDVGGADTAILEWIARRDRDGVPIHRHA